MRYLADLLTFIRLILAIVLLVLAAEHGSADNAFLVFLAAELTDTFDGTCARKWPFPKNKVPRYRKYAAFYDMFSDTLLAAAQVLFVMLNIDFFVGLGFAIFYIVVCGGIEILVYGKFFGHPDNFTRTSLSNRNFPLAKKIIMTRRYAYALCLGVINAIILFATSWSLPVKILWFMVGCSIYVFSWFFLRQRRENISRDAVKEEKKLTARAKRLAKKAVSKTKPKSKGKNIAGKEK